MQLILDSRKRKELKIHFQTLADDPLDRIAPLELGLAIAPIEIRVRFVAQPLFREHERPETFPSHVPALLFKPVVFQHKLRHDRICALLYEGGRTGISIAHNDAHTLGLGCEGKDREDVEAECLP